MKKSAPLVATIFVLGLSWNSFAGKKGAVPLRKPPAIKGEYVCDYVPPDYGFEEFLDSKCNREKPFSISIAANRSGYACCIQK